MRKLRVYRQVVLSGAIMAGLCTVGVSAKAQDVVAPNSLATTQGGVDDAFPFFGGPIRYQEVYNRNQFTGVSGLITQIAFRPYDPTGDPFSITIPNIQISLSTTNISTTTLSTTFANNVGADNRIVYSGSLTLSSNVTTLPDGTTAFDITIPLQNTFAYDPSKGNLLIDITNIMGTAPNSEALDSATSSGAGVERVFGGVNATTGTKDNGNVNDAGVVTKFSFSAAVPEPASPWLFVSGGIALSALMLWRRNQPTRRNRRLDNSI